MQNIGTNSWSRTFTLRLISLQAWLGFPQELTVSPIEAGMCIGYVGCYDRIVHVYHLNWYSWCEVLDEYSEAQMVSQDDVQQQRSFSGETYSELVSRLSDGTVFSLYN